jgi:hypothetical protein
VMAVRAARKAGRVKGLRDQYEVLLVPHPGANARLIGTPPFFRINFPSPPSSGRSDAVPAGCPVTRVHG